MKSKRIFKINLDNSIVGMSESDFETSFEDLND
jgi:hypothetical protein